MADKDDRLYISPLPFGIPQLDMLLGYEDVPQQPPDRSDSNQPHDILDCFHKPNSLALVGRDGTGKSVFAFHLASTYHALHFYATQKELLPEKRQKPPLIVYISSDLRWVAAEKMWRNFYLDYPWTRFVPFISPNELDFRRAQLNAPPFHVQLIEHSPGGKQGHANIKALESFLEGARSQEERQRQVCF